MCGHPPDSVTVVGYKFKEARFTDLHRAALSYPSSSFAYIGTEMSSPGAEEGERRVMALFQEDPYGCQEPLSSKRAERDPFAEGGYSPDRSPPNHVLGIGEGLTEFQFWLYVSMVIFLTLIAGLMSGLTLGLMSIDSVELEILRRTGSPSRQASSAAIMPLLQHPHRLLVTLLLCNSAAAEALPLYLDRLANPVTAVIVSVTVVGAWCAPFVHVLMFCSAPLSVPIAWILDHVLGKHQTALFKRSQLKALVDIHQEGQIHGGPLSPDEVAIIKGALDLTSKTAERAMTPLDLAFMLSTDTVLDEATRTAVLASGHSRIPVYRAGNRNDILGITLVKEMVQGLEGAARAGAPGPPRVGDLKIRSMPTLLAKTPMYDMLKLFKIGRSHMAVLAAAAAERRLLAAYDSSDSSGAETDYWLLPRRRRSGRRKRSGSSGSASLSSGSSSSDSSDEEEIDPHDDADLLVEWRSDELLPVGIITIEDVIEELIQSEIVDETDQFVDNLHMMRVNARTMTSSLPAHLRRLLGSKQLVPRIGNASDVEALAAPACSGGSFAEQGGGEGGPGADHAPSPAGAKSAGNSFKRAAPITAHPLPTLSLSARDGLLDALSRELSDSLVPPARPLYSRQSSLRSCASSTHGPEDARDAPGNRPEAAARPSGVSEDAQSVEPRTASGPDGSRDSGSSEEPPPQQEGPARQARPAAAEQASPGRRAVNGVRRSSTGGGAPARTGEGSGRGGTHFTKEVQDQLERIVPILRRNAAERRAGA
ncbi:hypothetical protein QBZ16_002984 [Prototheca wickerhamii]|uniref:CNNM transmembrane domain-containing protein n=1 Tax=Prototheca wickerhamii TaxID=3111 RepID=A0AAD9MM92_PROWI|nr:hypothetical protein QBZ16_002984 [Prototheca wickerhamii]